MSGRHFKFSNMAALSLKYDFITFRIRFCCQNFVKILLDMLRNLCPNLVKICRQEIWFLDENILKSW